MPNKFAADLRRIRTNTIGVLVQEMNSHFMADVLNGIEQVVEEAHYELVICHSGDSVVKDAAFANFLLDQKVDGLIVSLAFDTCNLAHFNSFSRKGIPIVFFDQVENYSPGVKVMIDNHKAGYDAAVHLTQVSCLQMLHVAGNLKRNMYMDRWLGFQDGLSQFGLNAGIDQLIICDFSVEDCIRAAQKILERTVLPDGIFIADDLCAAICMQQFMKVGIKVPEEIAIVGFNNDGCSTIVEPQLTTFDFPGHQMGTVAANSLMELLIKGRVTYESRSIVLRPELLVRASTTRD
jgi:LacI family transcriptional regulator